MPVLREWLDHMLTLTRGGLRVWWRLLPLLLGTWTLGWVGYQLSLVGSAFISDKHPWLALMLISFGFVSLLSGTIICLRFLGVELGIRDQVPEVATDDDRDSSVSRLVAITLLPFLGMYAAFGRVQDTANEVIAYEIITRGLLEKGVMTTVSPRTTQQIITVGVIVVGCYFLRRIVDAIHDLTNFRPLGLVAALIEGFLMLLLIFSGVGLIQRVWLWLLDRQFVHWLEVLRNGWTTSASRIADVIPDLVSWVWTSFWGDVWPLFLTALAEPVVWLAVAALVYGTHVLSFAEMWRKGEPLSVHLDNERTLRTRRAAARETQDSGRARAIVLRTQELFFGDLDDKYLPTFQSLRLILRGGTAFLAAYVVVYTVFSTVERFVGWAVMDLMRGFGGDQVFWISWRQTVDLIAQPLGETLRLSLLAVAFARTLQIFKSKADPSAVADAPAAGTELAPLTAAKVSQAEHGGPARLVAEVMTR